MEAIYASGFAVARDEYQVFAQAEGYLSAKLVMDGDTVRRGDPLFIIEADQQSARYRIARENYDMASANYRKGSPVLSELTARGWARRPVVRFAVVIGTVAWVSLHLGTPHPYA